MVFDLMYTIRAWAILALAINIYQVVLLESSKSLWVHCLRKLILIVWHWQEERASIHVLAIRTRPLHALLLIHNLLLIELDCVRECWVTSSVCLFLS